MATALGRGSALPSLLLALTLCAVPAFTDGVRSPLVDEASRKAALDFKLQDASGATGSLAEYRGKVVVLNFWATWCGGCKEELPWFAEFHATYAPRGLVILGVSLDEEGWSVVKPFVAEKKLPYRVLLGNEVTGATYKIEEMPVTHLIDRKGRIAASYVGVIDKQDLESKIAAMLAKP